MKSSDKEVKISTSENWLALYSFVRYLDNSSVKFSINAHSHFFEIKNFEFYSDTVLFKNFLGGLKEIYRNERKSVELSPAFEDDLIKILADDLGHIRIICEVYNHNVYKETCRLSFELDQTFLPNFIKDLEQVYLELGFPILG